MNGNLKRLKELRETIDTDPLHIALGQDNPIQIGALFKKFLRDLPEPLLTSNLHHLFVSSQKLTHYEDRLSAIHLIFCFLPKTNLVNILEM
jgi:hypothetical protein